MAKFIEQVEGVAATRFNKSGTREAPLYWQREDGVFSFDAKRLSHFVAYVERQKEHHAAGTPVPVLERTAEGGVSVVREGLNVCAVGYDSWWQEMQALA